MTRAETATFFRNQADHYRDLGQIALADDYKLAAEAFKAVERLEVELRAVREELDTLRAEATRLREALESAVDELLTVRQDYAGDTPYCQSCLARCDGKMADIHHSADCAGMIARQALSSTPTTAEWLAARDAEMKRLGAAEELEKAAQTLKEDLVDMNPPEFASRGKVQPGYCEALRETIDGMLDHAERLRRGE